MSATSAVPLLRPTPANIWRVLSSIRTQHRRYAIGSAIFALLALAGATAREWPQLTHRGELARLFSGPGNFAPASILAAIVHGQSVATAYAHSGQPYPLPYLLLFYPFGLLDDPFIRPVVTLTCLGLFLFSIRLLAEGWRNAGWLPALLSVPLFADLLSGHVTSQLGLFGLCLAAWAQPRRRWVLVGVGIAISFVRPPNALPLLAVLILIGWSEPIGLLRAALWGAVAMLPLVGLSFWLDPAWVSVYISNVGHTDYAGLPLLAIKFGGVWGVLLLQLGAVAVALLLARSRGDEPLDPDLAALVIAIGIVPSKLAGPYSGIFALPALARLGLRPQLALSPWLASGAAWLLELSFFPELLAGALAPPQWESAIAYWFVVASWPLAIGAKATHTTELGHTR